MTAGCGTCRFQKSGCGKCLSEFEHKVRHQLKEMLWEQEHPGEDLPPKLSMKYGIGDLADDQGNLRKAIAKMLPAAKDRVHATYKPDELRD